MVLTKEDIIDFRNFFKKDNKATAVSLHVLVNKTLEIIGKSIENNGIILEKDFEELVEIETYANEMTQVILNILKNAEEAFKEKSIPNAKISIKIYESDNSQIIEIQDNAGGIPEDIIAKVFDPYFSTKKEKNGTGHGLYMSKTIVEDHCNGKISVENSNGGVVFKIVIPVI